MSTHTLVADFITQYAPVQKERFEHRFTDPILVVEFEKVPQSERDFKTLSDNGEGAKPTEWENGPERIPEGSIAVPLVKSDRNTFHHMITLGRASNNDVVVPHKSVSKFHAFFKKDLRTGGVTISDAGSTFGTSVNRRPLQQGENRPLNSGDTVLFAGTVLSTFFSPGDFHDYLKLMERMGGAQGR